MAFNVSIDQDYVIRRINDWYIKANENKIYGVIEPFGINIPSQVSGYIVSYVDRHLMARIDCRLYALVLGNINDTYKDRKNFYKEYINNIVSEPNIVI